MLTNMNESQNNNAKRKKLEQQQKKNYILHDYIYVFYSDFSGCLGKGER